MMLAFTSLGELVLMMEQNGFIMVAGVTIW